MSSSIDSTHSLGAWAPTPWLGAWDTGLKKKKKQDDLPTGADDGSESLVRESSGKVEKKKRKKDAEF